VGRRRRRRWDSRRPRNTGIRLRSTKTCIRRSFHYHQCWIAAAKLGAILGDNWRGPKAVCRGQSLDPSHTELLKGYVLRIRPLTARRWMPDFIAYTSSSKKTSGCSALRRAMDGVMPKSNTPSPSYENSRSRGTTVQPASSDVACAQTHRHSSGFGRRNLDPIRGLGPTRSSRSYDAFIVCTLRCPARSALERFHPRRLTRPCWPHYNCSPELEVKIPPKVSGCATLSFNVRGPLVPV